MGKVKQEKGDGETRRKENRRGVERKNRKQERGGMGKVKLGRE
jgi:hypothetical protein